MASSLVERLASNLEGVIAHEIAPIIASRGEVRITQQDLGLILKSRKEYLEQKESAPSDVYRYFREPVGSMIKEWNE